jgi:hypothetical protein
LTRAAPNAERVRGCLTFLLVVAATILVASWLFLPAAAAGVMTGALGAAGFTGTGTALTVTADPPIALLALHADRIHVRSTNAVFHEVRMARVDLTLGDVGLLDRTAGSVDGMLTGVEIDQPGGPPIHASSVVLAGSSAALRATLTLSTEDVSAIAGLAVAAVAGTSPSRVTLGSPDRVTVVVGALSLTGRLVVDAAGGLVFRPTAPIGGVTGDVDLIRPGPDVPLRIRTVSLAPTGATITATIDPSALSD